MLEGIKSSIKGAWRALRGACVSRKALGRVGYYAALAALLAILGLASYAYRARIGRATGGAPQPPEVLSVQAQAVPATPEPTPEPERWLWPLEGEIIQPYSPVTPVWSRTMEQWQTHAALDIVGSPGEAVYACRDGEVADAWSDRLWGNVITIDHGDGYQSTYAGLNTLNMVSVGERVRAGQVIGSVGQSAACEADAGWHLHFELTLDGAPEDFAALAGKAGE